jgi:hypothetical protein
MQMKNLHATLLGNPSARHDDGKMRSHSKTVVLAVTAVTVLILVVVAIIVRPVIAAQIAPILAGVAVLIKVVAGKPRPDDGPPISHTRSIDAP